MIHIMPIGSHLVRRKVGNKYIHELEPSDVEVAYFPSDETTPDPSGAP
jgi:hypothetical protein